MAPPSLRRLVPDAPQALGDIVDAARGPIAPPIRAEIFGLERFAQHGRSLGESHRAAAANPRAAGFIPRLRSNISMLREAHRYIGVQAATGYDISPAAEWLLDNFHVIEAQLDQARQGLPHRYFRDLPVLIDEPLAGLPRVYGVAWAFVAHTDGAFDEDMLVHFLAAYQEARALNLNEMWALPTTLRVVLIENLRRLAERVACNKAARELANLCCDRIETYSPHALDQLLALLEQRGVGQVFLAQMALRLQGAGLAGPPSLHGWLRAALPDAAALQAQQGADQTADNLSVSNAVMSLRTIGDTDWPGLVARSSVLMRRMLGSPEFAAEHAETRDQTLHAIEQLARRSGRSEAAVAEALLELMRAPGPPDGIGRLAGHWLLGAGRPTLAHALGLPDERLLPRRPLAGRVAWQAYLGTLLVVTLALVAWLLGRDEARGALGALAALLMLFPASEAAVAVVNRLISESVRPQHLPRLALAEGIPLEHRVMVVIPALLTDAGTGRELAHRLLLHHLANPERHAQFALLTDWADADTERLDSDDALLAAATEPLRELNRVHAGEPGAAPRFIVLHRARRYSPTERRWIGWERKRGKLEQLVATLAQPAPAAAAGFLDLGEGSRIAPDTRYIVTLDSDTQLPPGRLRELVGVAAHPSNRPRLDAAGHSVVAGYGILQPRMVTPLPARLSVTPYHWLFSGPCGNDPYSAASSEVYQDLFGEGSFSGKGLLDVHALNAVLVGRLPDGLVLSHDLLEGSIARCAVVTDLSWIEDAPFHADVAAARLHRWMRGDWQLLPILLRPGRWPLRAINRWKMIDNLRRSLVAPASLALLMLALLTGTVSPWTVLALTLAAFSAGPLLGALAGCAPSRDGVARRHFYRQAGADLARALCGGLWHLAQLLPAALKAVDAMLRSAYRMTVSHRHLLQWTTASALQARSSTALATLLRQHWALPPAALALLATLLAAATPHAALAGALCLLWAGSPLWTWWVSTPHPARRDTGLPAADRAHLEGVARDTWRLFERCVGAADHHLPPDNLQTLPHDIVAHRTSPTNIGMYLLSVACARQFGWIGTQELLARLEATLGTLAGLQRHRGHFLNWYDTHSAAPLLPMYVSTVDSGNLGAMLLALAAACRELAQAPHDEAAVRHALDASRRRLAPLRAAPQGALARLLALPDPLAAARSDAAGLLHLLDQADDEQTRDDAATRPEERAWLLADHLATLRSLARDAGADEAAAGRRLRALADAAEQLAWAPEFAFLYHRKRHLFHIGYRLAEQELDAGLYDLLASEARLTSLLAIGKGDVPVAHWAALGRPFHAVGTLAGLRSWSGSMFEYLMPRLLIDDPHGSVLWEACRAAIDEQVAFGRAHDLPWGQSESAHAAQDHTLAYQYGPQGVPRLALRRTPLDERVVAPYATVLALQVAPQRALRNLEALEARSARGRYGFIEALDFSPSRQTGDTGCMPVATFMAHHQGMSLVALANVLLGGAAQRWGMAHPRIEAVASLLHERPPREVSRLRLPPAGLPPQALARRAPGLLREVLPGAGVPEPTQLLSNGRYSVSLRPNGAGWSRWRHADVTRWRDDALRDAHGSFCYLRWERQPQAVSITQHPAPDPAAHYASTFHADRVCFDATWPELQARTTVWVSPEDDIEFRQVELRNLGERSLDIELLSAFEPTLADARADEAHPAFSNLFVRAEWRAGPQALVFERKPRLPGEQGLHGAHFLTHGDPQILGVSLQVDRQRWLGRNRGAARPLASLEAVPPTFEPALLDTGLDPVCALAVRLQIAPRGHAQITFATAASDHAETLHAVIDKYRQPSHVQRASLMSATLMGVRLRTLRIGAEELAATQTLTTALVLTLTRPPAAPAPTDDGAACDRRLLWRFGISGDRPILLVSAGTMQGIGLLHSLAQALRLWAWGGVSCDLVVVNAEPASYQMALQHALVAMGERHAAEAAAGAGTGAPATTALHVLRADELSADELGTLRTLARVRLQADGRPLLHHVQAWSAQHERALDERLAVATIAVPLAATGREAVAAPTGAFAADSGEFGFTVGARLRPPRPWVNVLANPAFGAQLSEAGGGYSWALNSRLHQLTAWSNDAVADPPSEWFLLQDRRTGQAWSVAPSAWGDGSADYRVTHGQGYSRIAHRRGDLEVTATWCVDPTSAVKQIVLRLVNRGTRPLALRMIGIAEWQLGASRADRGSTCTALHRQRLPPSHAGGGRGHKLTALLCTQRERSAGFGGGTAFLAIGGADDEPEDWTCDRRECFDARGRLVLPDHYGQRQGDGLDPCAALARRLDLLPGRTAECVFLLGHAASPAAARELATRAATVPAAQRLQASRDGWDRLLGATTVRTPDPLFDALVNRWLPYQTVACRLWAKAGFYQAGGATGFRDQLQDAMALTWAAPDLLREQIALCASRQFPEGDVQHWWHAPRGAGVRTRFSDDLLWLPHACVHYLRATGDAALLDRGVPFITGAAIPAGAEDAYDTPGIGAEEASVYEHAARAIDHSLRVGAHGLPLMGSGDWNDGMNRVGHEGRGESVWLGWFLCRLVADFAPLARERGDTARAARWEQAAQGWQTALHGAAWDGRWFRRAFFDDGQPLGSHTNTEARIDLIAQAWAVLSSAAAPALQRAAMEAVEEHLVDADAGLIRLLDPPLAHQQPSAGYIQAYPPGVRENGGQYAHAGVWALMAQAELARAGPASDAATDRPYRYFTWLSPAHRSAHPTQGLAYGLEPYVMAGDVYTQPPHVGRGGWSWYTGAAAWMHRAAIESLFGLRLEAQELHFLPCLPSAWPEAELTLRRDGRTLRFILLRAGASDALAATAHQGARLLRPGERLAWPQLAGAHCFVLPLLGEGAPAPT